MGRVFSGIQPTGDLHFGNYLGVIRKLGLLGFLLLSHLMGAMNFDRLKHMFLART